MIPQPHITALAAYPLVDMTVPAGKRLVALAQNESFRGPSPAAMAAARQGLQEAPLYADPDWSALRHALAAHHQIDADNIIGGAGSLDIIGALTRIYTSPARSMLIPAHAYPYFRSCAAVAGARCDAAPERHGHVDVDALLAAVRPDTGLVCVANPGNPTGTWLPHSEIERLRAGLRDDILLLVDEAYGEFAPDPSGAASDLVARGNTGVLRTFSKAYGMAGFRVGWGLFPDLVCTELKKVLNPHNITEAAMAAAIAALADQDYMRATVAQIAKLRDQVTQELRVAGHIVPDSHTNFVIMDMGTPERAQRLDAALKAEGVFLRLQAGAALPHMVRMTLGRPEDVDFATALLCDLAPG